MTRNEINKYLAVILSTLRECGDAPEGFVYTALSTKGVSYEDFSVLRSVLFGSKLVAAPSKDVMQLTVEGRELAEKVDAHFGWGA